MNFKFAEIGVLAGAALLEVSGDALIRKGLQGAGVVVVVLGAAVLGSYGVLVNLLAMDFGKLLGAYVGFFGTIGVLFGWLVFGERVAPTTWVGLGVLLAGSLIIQFGP